MKKYKINRSILKCDYIRYSPSELSSISTPNSQTYINIPREDSVNTVSNSHIDVNFDVSHAATNNRYADDDSIRLINLGPIGLFSIYKISSISGKHLEEIRQAHIVRLIYKLITGARDSDDLSIGFDRSRERRQRGLTNNKNIKGKNHVRIYLRDIFGFAEHQEKAVCGLGYRLTLTGNTDKAVLNKDNATNNAKIKTNSVDWYISHYTPSLEQQTILSNHIVKEIPTELQYVEGSVFVK